MICIYKVFYTGDLILRVNFDGITIMNVGI